LSLKNILQYLDTIDRELYIDINACFNIIKSGKVLKVLEKEGIILE
jgi:histidine ammonia-lyase